MSMPLRLLPVLLLLLALAAGEARAQAQVQQDVPPALQRPVMTFVWVREGPAEKCRDHCREWIAAKGMIDANSARTFAEFTRTNNIQGATLVIESEAAR